MTKFIWFGCGNIFGSPRLTKKYFPTPHQINFVIYGINLLFVILHASGCYYKNIYKKNIFIGWKSREWQCRWTFTKLVPLRDSYWNCRDSYKNCILMLVIWFYKDMMMMMMMMMMMLIGCKVMHLMMK